MLPRAAYKEGATSRRAFVRQHGKEGRQQKNEVMFSFQHKQRTLPAASNLQTARVHASSARNICCRKRQECLLAKFHVSRARACFPLSCGAAGSIPYTPHARQSVPIYKRRQQYVELPSAHFLAKNLFCLCSVPKTCLVAPEG